MKKELLRDIKTLITAIILAFGILTVSAWNGPISTPPQGNGYAPINTTATSQTKSGSLWASGFFTTGGGYFGGDVGIGTQSPEARLDVRSGPCYYKLQADGFFTNCSLNTLLPPEDPTIYLTISSDTANYNIANALNNPITPQVVVLTIDTGVRVYSGSISQVAIDTGNLPTGSSVKIINNGSIVGRGGNGACAGGGTGQNGGDAIKISIQIEIDNTNGYIFGAGGGGGSGDDPAGAGGGAPDGQGCGGGNGSWSGTGGDGPNRWGTVPGGNGANYNGTPGVGGSPGETQGGTGGGGSGGAGGTGSGGCCDGQGGGGGGWGGGGGGGAGVETSRNIGAGGSAGKAISLNGQSVTWLGGNNGTQVKGAVQ